MVAFVSKYGINPSKLFGDVTKTQKQKLMHKLLQIKLLQMLHLKLLQIELQLLLKCKIVLVFGERLHFTGGEKDDVKNLKNYTLFDKDRNFK